MLEAFGDSCTGIDDETDCLGKALDGEKNVHVRMPPDFDQAGDR